MCGFVGVFGAQSKIDLDTFGAACRQISHRGPDAFDIFSRPEIKLGHCRLSVLDLSVAANQPMCDPTGRVVVVHNGEVYNYRLLREALEGRGHRFVTTSDTEVVLAMYLEYGEHCVALLEGMFAFAVWDGRHNSLLVARDRAGIKPVYYAQTHDGFAFASEIKALLSLGLLTRSVNRQALHDYLTFRYTISPQTMFEGVHKLPPAHYAVVTESGARFTRYWSLDYSKTLTLSNDEWIATLRSKLDAAVKRQLISDVPIGLMLSGGLDSSVLATAMQRELSQPLKTFCIGVVAEGALDERYYAGIVAKHVGSEHHEIAISAKDFMDTLPAFVWHMDEPVADPASIPLYWLSKLAKRHVTVVLSGEGSDEMFGGYPFWTHYKGYARAKWARKIPGALRNRLLRPLNRFWPKSDRLEKYLEMCTQPLAAYGRFNPEFQDNVLCEEEKWRLYRNRGFTTLPLAPSVEKVREAYRRAEDFELLDQMLSVSMTQWLPENLLIKADRMAMAHALELRVPFLDEDVVEFVARMPTDLKIRKSGAGYTVKYALKKAYQDVLPREIIERQKLGFPVPYARWLRLEMREMVFDVLLSKSAREHSPWDTAEVERLISCALAPDEEADKAVWNPHAKKVWSLLVFELWRERFGVSV